MSGVEGSKLRQSQMPLLQVFPPISNRYPPPPIPIDPHLFQRFYGVLPPGYAAAASASAAAAASQRAMLLPPEPERLSGVSAATGAREDVVADAGAHKDEVAAAGAGTDVIGAPKLESTPTDRAADLGVEKGKVSVKREIEEMISLEFDRAGPSKKQKHSKGASSSGSCRYDNSLGLLTKKFISVLQEAEDGTLDLNEAAEILDVQKRRIYDITNVLEGIDMIEKTLKNRIRLKGNDMSKPKEMVEQIARLKAEVDYLSNEEQKLDAMISDVQVDLSEFPEDENNQKWLYVTKEDITSIPQFKDDLLIAIKAPRGTSIEVPDPDEGVDFPDKRYQMYLRSSVGPIDSFLISNEERLEATNQDKHLASVENSGTASRQPGKEDIVGTSGAGQDRTTQGTCSGIVRIVPSETDMDSDYWLHSDPEVSITDMWI